MEYVLSSLLTQANCIPTSKIVASIVGLTEATVFGELCGEFDYWRARNEVTSDGYFFSTVENIENKLFIKRKQQEKIIKNLVNSGLISVKKKGCPAKRYIKINQENLATLLVQNGLSSTDEMSELVRTKCTTKDTIYKDTIIKNKEKEINKEKEKEQLEENFLEFWNLYPRKIAKAKARESYFKAITKASSDVIIQGVNNYIKQIKLKDTEEQYIAHPTTWLNQERWEDSYDLEVVQKNDSSSPSRLAKPQDDYVHYKYDDTWEKELEKRGFTEYEFIAKINEWKESVYKETGEFNKEPDGDVILKILNREI